MNELPKLLSTKDAAEILGISEASLIAWRCAGDYRLPIVRIGRQVKYKLSDVLSYIDSNRQTGSAALDNLEPPA